MIGCMLSVVVVSFNESIKLRKCLSSVKDFASEIVIYDLGSTDGVEEVVGEFNGKLISGEKVNYVEKVREKAIQGASLEWVLVLDPDEIVSGGLAKEIPNLISQVEYVGVNIPRKNIFFGSWIKHSNFWPDRHIRLFKKSQVKWPTRIHTYPKVEGDILVLDADENKSIIHYGYDSWWDFIRRQLRYAKAEAENIRESQGGFSPFRLFWLPLREFLARFIKHTGYLDGLNGVFIVGVLMLYHLLVEYFVVVHKK